MEELTFELVQPQQPTEEQLQKQREPNRAVWSWSGRTAFNSRIDRRAIDTGQAGGTVLGAFRLSAPVSFSEQLR